MRASDEIGDDAFHQVEEELDWLEMAGGRGAVDCSLPPRAWINGVSDPLDGPSNLVQHY